MSEIVGEVEVLVRPSTVGFEEAATPGVTTAGKGLGTKLAKAMGAAFAAIGVAEIGKSVIRAATEQQAAFAILDRTIKNAGAANTLYGQTIEAVLQKEGRLKGFSEEDLASGFLRLVSVTKDSAKAFKDLGLAAMQEG